MRIATFFQPVKDCENLDLQTIITIPDQSLSVRDILHRFTRGQIELPPIDVGEDDSIDASLADFDDLTDAMDSIESANFSMRESIENAKREQKPTTDDGAKNVVTDSVTVDDSPNLQD